MFGSGDFGCMYDLVQLILAPTRGRGKERERETERERERGWFC